MKLPEITPAPWAVKTKGDDSRYIMANNGGGPFVARLVHSAADAKAIASVPALLEALNNLVNSALNYAGDIPGIDEGVAALRLAGAVE